MLEDILLSVNFCDMLYKMLPVALGCEACWHDAF